MKAGLSIQELAAEIDRRSKNKLDLTVPTQYLHMEPVSETIRTNEGVGVVDRVTGVQIAIRAGRPMYAKDDGAPIPNVFGVNKIAHDQLATYLGIPTRYYQRMLAEDPALLAENVNRWLREAGENRLVRTLDGTMRALLSDVYRPLDNEGLARAVLPVIAKLGLNIMSCQLTDKRLYLKVVDESVVRELANAGGIFGDGKHIIVHKVSPAIEIGNSEVGDGTVYVKSGVYSGWCTNMASFGERSAKKRHVGKRHELVSDELYSKFSPETRLLSDQATWAQLQETVKLSFDEAQFASLVTKIEGTQANPIEGKPVEVIKVAAKKFGLNENEQDDILKHLIEGGSLTQFGLHNAVTRAAQDVESYDRATELEGLGGKIIDLPRKEWVALSNAVALKEAA